MLQQICIGTSQLPRDKKIDSFNNNKKDDEVVKIPDSWQLTAEQRSFIESFIDEDVQTGDSAENEGEFHC